MTQFNETELTAAVIRSFDQTPDPRAKFLLQELVTSLHDYVRKTNLTFEEWDHAIGFLTRTGQKCTDIRQEFILLSDVLGVSMLVDAVNHRDRDGATETTVLGPFYVGEHKVTPHGTDISASLPGERMFVQSRVTDLKGRLQDYEWSPDSKRFALVVGDPDPEADAEPPAGGKPRVPKPIVIDRYKYK